MNNLTMGSYNDKISEIRVRVMSRQKDRDYGREGVYKYANENATHHPSKYQSSLSKYAGGYRDRQKYEVKPRQYESKHRDNYGTRQRDSLDYIGKQSFAPRFMQHYEQRKPLEARKQAESNVMDRVKELQSVNDKIKMMLANKRESLPSASITTGPPRSKSRYGKDQQQSTPHKKMTSLFQNQQPIVQSKVASKQKRITQYEGLHKVSFDKQYSREKRKQQQSEPKRKQQGLKGDKYFSVQTPLASLNEDVENQKYKSPCTRQLFSFEPEHQTQKQELRNVNIYTQQASKKHVNYDNFKINHSGKGQSKKLIAILTKQIQLDIKLRQSKEKFNNFTASDKLENIKNKVKKYGVNLRDEELENWIKISNQECDPFLQMNASTSFDYEEFAARIVASWQCWTNQVKQSVQIQGLERQGFTIQEIDLGGKGYLTMEDFVCYINISSDTFFRNRDVCPIFRRLNKVSHHDKLENKLRYEVFLSFMVK